MQAQRHRKAGRGARLINRQSAIHPAIQGFATRRTVEGDLGVAISCTGSQPERSDPKTVAGLQLVQEYPRLASTCSIRHSPFTLHHLQFLTRTFTSTFTPFTM
jgi:hypothetical protein